ncbi:pneumococcal serine-rich repeat protein isoform X2 [Drosophila subobscura]|uniref:pneumococcal serine-rich repeat protein isoform X2 n=1 Tax=Drosophila subobscura TaxID=7241 RepID=UPI00155AFF37|nr:pneumococcal serine-rich repeat protein isoform X2 [Drosophila subobscura]
MVDSVQCPVCTLYLHAGMNLSDHLETHPKEQVIKALVQMTIVGNTGMGNALAAAMLGNSSSSAAAAPGAGAADAGGSKDTVVAAVTATSASGADVKPVVVAASSSAGKPITAAATNAALQPPPLSSSSAAASSSVSSKLSNPPMKALKCAPPTTEARANNTSAPTTSSAMTAMYQPPLVTTEYRYTNQQQQQQQQPGFARGTSNATATATLVIPQVPQQHFLASSHTQQQQQQQQTHFAHQQQQQQHHPGLKFTYATTLPPPPPLQLFTQQQQQQQTVTQPHQKPPPAYGAAISQIRSQHNQNKQQQHQQQHQHQQLQQSSMPVALTTAAPRQQQQQQQSVTLQSYGSSAGSCSSSSSSSTAGRASRQTNSPFGALLNAAAAAASSSPSSASAAAASVLRYAESPVAHYLERDNGDFIVQETPKHIVECVEKEDGEFSVIERIYQSPPSVLHIHDDDEDEDEDEDDDEDEENEATALDEHDHVEDGDDERDENSRCRNLTKTTKKSRKTKPKRTSKKSTRQHHSDEEFMSISSGCESDSEPETKMEVQAVVQAAAVPPLCTAPSTSSAAAAAASVAVPALADGHSNSTSNSNSNSNAKSKKNRITVLSDVPLNMNEYLDLMGNIVASSRIGTSRPFAAVAPIPLVKVEKEEPLDEYDNAEGADPMLLLEHKPSLEQSCGTTSVIRMASAMSAATEDFTQPPPMKVEVEATTLLPQRFSTPAQLRGPKKLVIKPKATATATATATTTAAAITKQKTDTPSSSSAEPPAATSISKPGATELIHIKSEITELPTSSILEKHLTTRKHSTVNDDDARVLLEFANSKQPSTLAGGSASSTTFVVNANSGFPSAGSVFASSSGVVGAQLKAGQAKPGEEYILPDNNLEVDEIVISSSSSYASSVAQVHPSLPASLQPPAAAASFNDFNFLYHQTTTTATASANCAYFTPFGRQQQQQQQQHTQHGVSDATNAATLASSSSNSSAMDHDSMNATFRVAKTQSLQSWYQPEQEHDPQHQSEAATAAGGAGAGASSSSQNHEGAQPTNFNAALAAVDCCSVAVDGDVKYLDLDACKREQLSSSSNLPSASASTSTTSSSFAGAATESSLVGGLNIRTDEKMPAKGEISEQESNCDIENSWSQSVYGDISQRYFRNQFTGGYNPDWRQDYYPLQDLSAQQREHKRFDFNAADEEASTSSRKSHLIDEPPAAGTASSTSSALLAGPPIASTSRAAAEAAEAAAATATALAQRKPHRRKLYRCPHCDAIFEKLKERNAHMIGEHNYVRQNRRLICTQPQQQMGAAMLPPPPSQQQQQQLLMHGVGLGIAGDEFVQEDSKDGIVKIKQEQCQDRPDVEQLETSPELLTDVKDSQLLGIGDGEADGDIKPPSQLDQKMTLPPLAMTTPAAKLAALYRMLISYNESKLGQERNNLNELEQKAMEKSIFLCYVCRTDFPSVKLYDAHLTEHPAECFTCGKKFYRWKNFSLHLKRHLGWKEFGCYVCDKKFVVRSALVEHMRMHTGQTPLKCKICGKKFKRYSNLTQHRKRHTKVMVRKKEYVCHCGEVLPSKARFLWHKETHDVKPKCCPYCCDRFVHANSLRRHIRLAHSDKFDYAEPMECPMCKQIFAKTSIKAHMATHSTDPQYDCAICNKSFSTKWNLKIHSWVHANRTAKPFKCEYCPKAFVRELDFKNHINAHKQIKPYTCEYCGCKFIRKYNYMRHRREHHGTKKFTCDQCDKSFHRHYYLIEHRRMHTGERPFTCTICGKSSTTKTNHNKHLKIHHSRDPFTVEV